MLFLSVAMPRTKVRKTERGVDREVIESAAAAVQAGRSCSGVARQYGICNMTLSRYIKAKQLLGPGKLPRISYRSHTQVFNHEQEKKLAAYLVKASQIYFGLNCA